MKFFFLSFILLTGCIARAQYIITIAGDDTAGFSGDGGPAARAKLNEPERARPDHAGNIYIADEGNNRIRKVAADGVISTIAGNYGGATSGDGGPATAAGLDAPNTVTADTAGNIYLSDNGGGTGERIRKINTAGIISTIAGGGPGVPGSGDGGPATGAGIGVIADIAIDRVGNMYILDGSMANVRKIDAAGIIHTVAGNGTFGFSGDGGPATAAQLHQPHGIAVDNWGNVYIADYYNGRIRKVDTTGIITTIAGAGAPGTFGYSGDGGPATAAELAYPEGLAVDSTGNIYIADSRNGRIRKINTTGIITTVAGDSTRGYSGDGGPATAAELFNPTGVALDDSGNIYVTDAANNDVRKVTDHLPITEVNAINSLPGRDVLSIYPNPNDGAFTVYLSSNNMETVQLAITNIVGQAIKKMITATNKIESVQFTGPPGIYFISAVTADGRYSGKVVVE